ncbi:MAG: isoprenylcysteine carboxylmethyltransferase family protein [Rhodanobacteraceae bacterium]|nr:MAG: isoprenylcysteine carboxylmethyltransferase family protein [Rhodanobacteraceae bacterium]
MQGLIAQSHFHLLVLDAALILCYAPEWIGTFFQNPEKGAVRRDRGSYALIMVSMFAGIFLAFFAAFGVPATTIAWQQPSVFWVGIVLMLAGTAFRWYAIKVLGRFFTRSVATREGQYVVETGPYRLIRHPSYTGAMVTILGLGLAMTNWLSLLLVALGTLIGYEYRVRVEERALCEGIGNAYREYMRRTKRFVPFVW